MWPELVKLRSNWLQSDYHLPRIASGIPRGAQKNSPGWIDLHFSSWSPELAILTFKSRGLIFPLKTIRKKKLEKLLVLGGACSKGSVREKNIIPQMALMPFIVKFIFPLFKIGVSYVVMASAIATISKYHITDRDSSINVGRHTLGLPPL